MTRFARSFFLTLALLVGGWMLSLSPVLAAPQINNQINYQARLMDASGFPVADGNYSIIFSLYDASTAGNRIWTAAGTLATPTALTVNVQNGLFTILLGDTGQNTLDTVNWNSDQIFLGVTVNADAEMSPRKRFASAPQAFNARQLQGMYASSTASGGQTLFTLNQTENNAATGSRSTLDVRSSGTSNSNDFLIRGINDLGTTVFSVNRQGSVTSTISFSVFASSTTLNANIATFATATVAGQGICLSNGQFCSTGSVAEADTLQTVTNRGAFTTTTLSLFGGLTTSNLTATGTTSLQNVSAGTVTAANLFTTGITSSTRYFADDGSAATPAYSFTSDQDSGMFRSASFLGLARNGTSMILMSDSGVHINFGLIPIAPGLQDIGSSGLEWRNAWFSGTVTSTALAAATGTFSGALTVTGQSVCLANGTNCPTASSTDLNWTFNLAGDFVRNATATTDIAIGSSTIGNAPFVFLNNTSTSRFLIGQNPTIGARADLVIGATTSSGMSPGFQLTGDDLFVAGNIGAASSIYTNGAFVAGTGTTFFSDGLISKTNGYLNVKSTSGTRITNALEQFISSDMSPTLLGSTGVIPKASRFVVVGNYAYVLSNSGPLYIVDISDPSHPTSTGFIDVPATPVSIAYAGGKIYVGTGTNDVYVYNVADKSAPSLVDTLVGAGSFIQIDGSNLYSIVIGSFNIFDLKGNLLSTFAISSNKFSVQNGRVYLLADTPDALVIYNVENPSNPVLLSTTTPFTTTPTNIAVKDRYAYVTEESANTFWIFDVFNPASVTVATSTTIPAPSFVTVSGRYAYVSSSTTDVVVLDVASSTAPVQVLDFETSPGSVRQFSIFGRYGILSGGGTPDGYLQIYDMKGTELQSLTAHSVQAGSVRVGDLFTVEGQSILNGGLQVGLEGITSGGSIFVSATNTTSTFSGYVKAARVQTTDVFEAFGPMTLGDDSGDLISFGGSIASDFIPDSAGRTLGSSIYPWDGYFRSVTTTSLFTSGRGVTAEPPAGFFPDADIASTSTLVGGNPIAIYASDRYLYYIGGNNGLEIIDITDPTAPFITASSSLNGFTTSEFVTNGVLMALVGTFTGTQRGVRILDVSNFANVTSVGDIVLSSDDVSDVEMSGKLVYAIASASSSLYIVDISTPGAPSLVSTLTGLGTPTDVKVRDGFAYITEGTGNSLIIVDIRRPERPVIVGSVAVANAPQDVLQQGRYAYVALSTTQFVTVDVSNPTAPYAIATSTCPSYDCTGGFIAGDYLVRRARSQSSPFNDFIHFWDISIATGPVTLSQLEMVEPIAPSEQMQKLTKHGSYVYTIHSNVFLGATTGVLSVVDTGGMKTDGLQAGTAEVGTLSVRNAAEIAKQLTVQGGLQVGANGILSLGPISSSATGTVSSLAGMFVVRTSTSTPAVTIENTLPDNTSETNWGAYINQLSVGSNAVATGTGNYSMVLTHANSASSGGLCIDDTGTGATCPNTGLSGVSLAADGTVVSNAFDLAEMYSVTGTTVAGDVLVLDTSATATVMRSTGVAYDSKVIGIVSTAPGFQLGWGGGAKVALTGRVPTKVSMNNGSIAVGDALVSSDVPGHAMKATQPGMILGYALANISVTGTAEVFVSVGFWAGLAFSPTGQIQIDDSGNVSIMNDLHVGGRLFPSLKGGGIQNEWFLFVNADDPTSTYISTNAAGFMSMDSYDFAERYYSPDELEPGDLVIVSVTGRTHVQRSLNEDDMLLGIVSTRPAFIAGRPATSTYPIALSGRVPTKVSNMNGAIKAGDPLAPTSIPGVAAKAVRSGPIIGLALEEFEGATIGKIEVFVNPSYWVNEHEVTEVTPEILSEAVASKAKQGYATIAAGSKRVHVSYDSIGAYPNVQVTLRGLIAGNWGTDGYSDTGFDIIMSEEQSFDAFFSWRVEPLHVNDRLNLSDGTTSGMDPVTGLPFGFTTPTTTESIIEDLEMDPEASPSTSVSVPTESVEQTSSIENISE